MTVRLKDIAQETGVSLSTVHQVLTGRADRFAPKTRAKVQRMAEKLGYRPNMNARGMQSGRSMLVGVLYSGVNHAGATSFFEGVQEGLAEQTYAPVTFTHHSIEQQLTCLKQCIERQIDGLIINTAVDPELPGYIGQIVSALPTGLPVIEVMGGFLPQVPSVGIDFDSAGRQCAAHLTQAGCDRVVMLTHDQHDRHRHATAPYHTDWLFSCGYRQAMREAGLADQVLTHALPEDIWVPGQVAACAYTFSAQWLKDQAGPGKLGLCAANDAQGTALVQAIREQFGPTQDRVHVAYAGDPRRIIACPPWCRVLPKPLKQLGRSAAHQVLARIAGQTVQEVLIAPTAPNTSG